MPNLRKKIYILYSGSYKFHASAVRNDVTNIVTSFDIMRQKPFIFFPNDRSGCPAPGFPRSRAVWSSPPLHPMHFSRFACTHGQTDIQQLKPCVCYGFFSVQTVKTSVAYFVIQLGLRFTHFFYIISKRVDPSLEPFFMSFHEHRTKTDPA